MDKLYEVLHQPVTGELKGWLDCILFIFILLVVSAVFNAFKGEK